MKKVWIFITAVSVFACTSSDKSAVESTKSNSKEDKVQTHDSLNSSIVINDEIQSDSALLIGLSRTIINEFNSNSFEFKNLDKYISSTGLIFVPYGYHNSSNVHLTKDSIWYYWGSNEKIKWGLYDGSGEEISLTLKEYFSEFIWDMNFSQADTVMLDDTKGLGNTIDNIKDYLPNARYVEFYIEGKNPDYGGMDWGILRLIYQKVDEEQFKLIAISHGQWTV